MATSETLSVRLKPETRRILADAAATHDAAGASALARDILEQWAEGTIAAKRRADVQTVASYLKAHPEGWDDNPEDFFPSPKATK